MVIECCATKSLQSCVRILKIHFKTLSMLSPIGRGKMTLFKRHLSHQIRNRETIKIIYRPQRSPTRTDLLRKPRLRAGFIKKEVHLPKSVRKWKPSTQKCLITDSKTSSSSLPCSRSASSLWALSRPRDNCCITNLASTLRHSSAKSPLRTRSSSTRRIYRHSFKAVIL